MKLFQKLLLAPAALGLLAPVAANAADVNIAGLSQYGTTSASGRAANQVTSITQFFDVQPTDWASGTEQPDRALRLRRWLPQRHLPRQPCDDPL